MGFGEPGTMLGHGARGDRLNGPAAEVRERRDGRAFEEREGAGVAELAMHSAELRSACARRRQNEQIIGCERRVRTICRRAGQGCDGRGIGRIARHEDDGLVERSAGVGERSPIGQGHGMRLCAEQATHRIPCAAGEGELLRSAPLQSDLGEVHRFDLFGEKAHDRAAQTHERSEHLSHRRRR